MTAIKYCLTECPYDKPYKDNTKNECLAECSENTYLDESTKTCLTTCPSLSYFDEDESNYKGKCITGTECPSSYPYLYETLNVCLDDCFHLKIYYMRFNLAVRNDYYYVNEDDN